MDQATLTVALVALAVLLVITLIVLVSRRRAATPAARLDAAAEAMLSDVVIPDDDDGAIHLEYVLLCGHGIVVVDTRDAAGNVFGSDSMQEWAVITEKSRYGISNPQDGLYDRVAAVKRLVPDATPVKGYIAFTGAARFTKGVPSHVLLFDDLINELSGDAGNHKATEAFLPAWEALAVTANKG